MNERVVKVHFGRGQRGKREMRRGVSPKCDTPEGRVPRVARLMALAIRLESMIAEGAVGDQAELARAGRVSRARITQIMNLLGLAPDIQEAVLSMPRVTSGRDPVSERDLRPIVAHLDWSKQRRMWAQLTERSAG